MLTETENDMLTTAPAKPGDQELLREYAARQSEEAFAELTRRHVDWVYAAALRQTGNHALAQDVTQAVFIILARKAPSLSRQTILSGWLFRAVRYTVLDAHKLEKRRQLREQEAAQMEQTHSAGESEVAWEQLAPALDEAVAGLGEKDRQAILLRFFEKRSFGEIGAVLGGNENSARVRVVRAVEKLRGFFRKRGVAVSTVALGGALLSNAAQAAPSGLASSLAAWTTTSDHVASMALVRALLRRLFWRRTIRVGAAIAVFLLLIGGAMLSVRQWQVARAAELADAARSVRNLMIALETAYTANDGNGFLGLIHFHNPQEEQIGPALADYVRAQSLFRREMQRAFNVRRRSFDATFREIMWQPQEPCYLRSDRVSTNIMVAKYPIRFVKIGGVWKWDFFDGLSTELRTQRTAILRHKTGVLDKLTDQIQQGATTNVVEILETVRSAMP